MDDITLLLILCIVFTIVIRVYMPFTRIIVNPTPDTIKDSVYLDDVGVCYKYIQKVEECQDDEIYKENKHLVAEKKN